LKKGTETNQASGLEKRRGHGKEFVPKTKDKKGGENMGKRLYINRQGSGKSNILITKYERTASRGGGKRKKTNKTAVKEEKESRALRLSPTRRGGGTNLQK